MARVPAAGAIFFIPFRQRFQHEFARIVHTNSATSGIGGSGGTSGGCATLGAGILGGVEFPDREKTRPYPEPGRIFYRSGKNIDLPRQNPKHFPDREIQQEETMAITTPIQTAADLGKAVRERRKSDGLTLADVSPEPRRER